MDQGRLVMAIRGLVDKFVSGLLVVIWVTVDSGMDGVMLGRRIYSIAGYSC